jgi:predicted metalloendopeptidase
MKITRKRKYSRRKAIRRKKNITNSKRKITTSKKIEFNKYEKSRVHKNFKLIKMPYINTELVESKYLLWPLKNIHTNKESVDNEQSLLEEANNVEKIQKEYKLSPKKDYYTYINYAWMKAQNIVMDYKNYYFIKLDTFRFIQNTVNYRVIRLANEYCANNNTPFSRKVKNVIDSMTYKNLDDNKVIKHVKTMENEYEEYIGKDDLIGYLAAINRCEIISWGCPIVWDISQDEKDAVNLRSHIQSPQLSFYDYDLYITGKDNNKYTKEFKENFANKFCEFVGDLYDKMLGEGHGLNPRHVIECEIDMLNAMDCFQRGDSEEFYNVVTAEQSRTKYHFDWKKFAEGVGYKQAPRTYIAGSISYLSCIMKKLHADWKTPKWKAYWYYMYLRQLCLYSNKTSRLRFNFFNKFAKGQQANMPNELFPLFALSYCFNTLLSRLYVEKYVHSQAVYIANTIGNDLRNVFIRIINENLWLQPETKLEALKKLETISIETVYPKYMIDDLVADLPIMDAYGIMYAQSQVRREYLIAHDGQHYVELPDINFSVNGGLALSGTQPYIVNAFYNSTKNNIYIPAATLQEPFVSLNLTGLEYNLAHIGYTFGHELSHCLDNTGRLYDYKGNMRNWWLPQDAKIFEDKVKNVIKQYELFASWDGIKMDASMMVGESVADISGIEICVNYLNNYLNSNDEPKKVKDDSLKKFFVYIAFQWREAIYKQSINFNIKTNPHPLVKYRTNCPMSRLKIFKKLYDVKKGDRMYWNNDTIWSNSK